MKTILNFLYTLVVFTFLTLNVNGHENVSPTADDIVGRLRRLTRGVMYSPNTIDDHRHIREYDEDDQFSRNLAPKKKEDKKAPAPSITTTAADTTTATAAKSTKAPSVKSTKAPSVKSTKAPSVKSTKAPSVKSTKAPSVKSTKAPSEKSTKAPSVKSTKAPGSKSTKVPSIRLRGRRVRESRQYEGPFTW